MSDGWIDAKNPTPMLAMLDAERERYAVGMSTNFLVLTRQNELARARLDEIASLYDYRNARTSVARATGTLLEDHGIDVMEGTAGRGRPGGFRSRGARGCARRASSSSS